MATTTKSVPAIPEYKSCKVDNIIEYCTATNEVDWLKKANENNKTFFQLRKAFYMEFAPALIPVKAKKSYKDRIAAL